MSDKKLILAPGSLQVFPEIKRMVTSVFDTPQETSTKKTVTHNRVSLAKDISILTQSSTEI